MKKPFKKNRSIRYNYYKKYQDIKGIIEKRYNLLAGVITVFILILLVGLFRIQVIEHKTYVVKLEQLSRRIIEGSTAPRGRIYDRNHQLLVDNEPTRVIYYKKQSGIKTNEEIELAYEVANMIMLPTSKLSNTNLRIFWVKQHPDLAKAKITDEEWKALEERRLTSSEIEQFKLERITDEELSHYTEYDLEAAYIYTLMNKGYSYSEKVIKDEDVTDEEYAMIASNVDHLKGFDTKLDWDRVYLYGDTFRTVLGNVSSSDTGVPAEFKQYYTEKGYALDDRVGISYLEYQYDDYLKGAKDQYELQADGSKILTQQGSRGNDLVLTIDIRLQQAIEQIITEEIIKAKSEPNTEYYNHSFVIVSDPNTGEILAMAGKQVVWKDGDYQVYDYAPGITTSPVTVGSIIKGASQIVGYNTGALQIGEQRYDTCVKLRGAPQKCSWKPLGYLNDLTALKYSSNTYQFYTALKVAGVDYYYDMPLQVSEDAFSIYRDTFAQFGLGVETGIDLPLESLGYKGKSEVGGLLLDFAIGQYDTYTPIQLSQYIGTIANGGKRIQPHLLKQVYSSEADSFTHLLYEVPTTVLNTLDTQYEYLERVKLGFQEVMKYGGTGSGFINLDYNPAGKTGTSQSFIDTDGNGVIDKETISMTFAGYAPADNPRVTFTVISPNIYHYDNGSSYQSFVNRRISKRVSDVYFTLYP